MVQALEARRAIADSKVVVDYGLHMTITPDDMDRLDQVTNAYAAGCASFKLYMAYGLRLDDGQMLRAMEAIAAVGGLPVVHAENWEVITTLVRRNLAHGRTSPHWHPRSRPAIMEGEAAGRVIDLAELAGTPLHIFHVSCAATAGRIAAAKARGRPVSAETCPQYLYLTDELLDRPGVEGALPVCAPPLRPKADQDALWAALRDGTLDLVSTDHCPFTREEKASGLHDFSQIPGGVPSIESRLALVYAGLVSSPPHPATSRSTLRPSPTPSTKEFTISFSALHETAGWTPYAGLSLRGWPEVTISRGEVVVENGRFLGTPGRGRFVHRQ
jgi:dihydropyrimidinase